MLISILTIFILSMFLGWELITKVPPNLYTPLMSGSNAISGIILIGAIIATGNDLLSISKILGFIAIIFATTNIIGGFLVTHRMLELFNKKK